MSRSGLRALLTWLLFCTLSAGYLWRHLQLQTDISSLLPRGMSPAQRLLLNQLRAGSTMRLMLISISGGEPEQLAAASRHLKQWMRDGGEFTWIANGDDAWSERERELLFQHRYLLSDKSRTETFSVDSIHNELQQRLTEIMSPIGMMTKSLIGSDPIGAFLSLAQGWQVQQAGPEKFQGVWVSAGQALLMAETRAPGYAFVPQQSLQSRLLKAFDDYRLAHREFHLQLLLSGPSVFTVKIQERIEADAWRLSLLASAFVISFLALTYRSLPVLGLSLVPLLSAILGGLTAVNIVFGFVHGITLAFGITLLGVVDDYPIHLFSHMDGRRPASQVMREIWSPMRLGILTTAIGFTALLFAPFPGLQHLGLFAVSGLITAALVTRFLLPDLVPNGFKARTAGRSWNRFAILLAKLKWVAFLGIGLALALVLVSWRSLWEQDVDRLTPLPATEKARDQALRQALGAPDVRYLLAAHGPDIESVLQTSEALGAELDRWVEHGELTGYDAVHRILPSHRTQELRQAALPDPAVLAKALATAQQGLPFKPSLFEPFLHDIGLAKKQPLLSLDDYRDTMFGTRLNALLQLDDAQWVALLPLRGVKNSEILRAHFASTQYAKSIYLDLKEESNAMVTGFRNGALGLLAWGTLAIALILALALKRLRQTMRVLTPMLGAVTCVAAMLHLMGEHLSLFHIAAFLLVVGLGLDYALFFNHSNDAKAEESSRTLYGLLVCSTTTILVFGILACSEVPALRSIGLTAALGSACSLLLAAMLARPETRATEP